MVGLGPIAGREAGDTRGFVVSTSGDGGILAAGGVDCAPTDSGLVAAGNVVQASADSAVIVGDSICKTVFATAANRGTDHA